MVLHPIFKMFQKVEGIEDGGRLIFGNWAKDKGTYTIKGGHEVSLTLKISNLILNLLGVHKALSNMPEE